jgi:hypothetical protein
MTEGEGIQRRRPLLIGLLILRIAHAKLRSTYTLRRTAATKSLWYHQIWRVSIGKYADSRMLLATATVMIYSPLLTCGQVALYTRPAFNCDSRFNGVAWTGLTFVWVWIWGQT